MDTPVPSPYSPSRCAWGPPAYEDGEEDAFYKLDLADILSDLPVDVAETYYATASDNCAKAEGNMVKRLRPPEDSVPLASGFNNPAYDAMRPSQPAVARKVPKVDRTMSGRRRRTYR